MKGFFTHFRMTREKSLELLLQCSIQHRIIYLFSHSGLKHTEECFHRIVKTLKELGPRQGFTISQARILHDSGGQIQIASAVDLDPRSRETILSQLSQRHRGTDIKVVYV